MILPLCTGVGKCKWDIFLTPTKTATRRYYQLTALNDMILERKLKELPEKVVEESKNKGLSVNCINAECMVVSKSTAPHGSFLLDMSKLSKHRCE